jgi:Flp pilus assembly protein TadG
MTLRRSRQHGGAAVEFALIAPMLSALVLGVLEAGHFTSNYQAASVCVRAGAREASLTTATATSVQTVTNNCLTDAGFSSVAPTLSPSNPASAASGSKLVVSFNLAYASWFGVYFTSKTMHFSCSMIKEH